MTDIDFMTRGFITVALWSDCEPLGMGDDGERGGLEYLKPNDDLVAWARGICGRFLAVTSEDDVDAFMNAYGDPDGGEPEEYLGHTLYLEAAGHGVSFRDRAWRGDDPMVAVCERLSAAAKSFRSDVEGSGVYQIDDESAGI